MKSTAIMIALVISAGIARADDCGYGTLIENCHAPPKTNWEAAIIACHDNVMPPTYSGDMTDAEVYPNSNPPNLDKLLLNDRWSDDFPAKKKCENIQSTLQQREDAKDWVDEAKFRADIAEKLKSDLLAIDRGLKDPNGKP